MIDAETLSAAFQSQDAGTRQGSLHGPVGAADDASGALIKTRGPRARVRGPTPVEVSNSHSVGLRAVRTHRSLFASVGGGPRRLATSTPLARIALATEATLRLVVRACANCARTRLAIST